jgi:hypothetical protein
MQIFQFDSIHIFQTAFTISEFGNTKIRSSFGTIKSHFTADLVAFRFASMVAFKFA